MSKASRYYLSLNWLITVHIQKESEGQRKRKNMKKKINKL